LLKDRVTSARTREGRNLAPLLTRRRRLSKVSAETFRCAIIVKALQNLPATAGTECVGLAFHAFLNRDSQV